MNSFDDDDFVEVEYSDLPEDEDAEGNISDKAIKSGAQPFLRMRQFMATLVLQSGRRIPLLRSWLLEDVSSKPLIAHSDSDSFELEIVDLPAGAEKSISSSLFVRRGPTLPKLRVWRIIVTTLALLSLFLLVAASFPSPRNWLYSQVVHATPTPTPIAIHRSFFQGTDQGSEIITNQNGSWWITQNGTVAATSPFIPKTPAPAPQAHLCSATPVQNIFSALGTNPVWITGFNGPYATLHLARAIPVPIYSGLYGFPAHVQVEIPANYQGPVTLEGHALSNDMSFLFGYSTYGDQFVPLTLNSDTTEGTPQIVQVDGSMRKVWNITLFLPSADCYTLKASWDEESWTVIFSAGA